MTTDEILQIIRRLSPDEQERIRRELSTTQEDRRDSDESLRRLLQVSGSAKVGNFLNADLDREFLYTEDPA